MDEQCSEEAPSEMKQVDINELIEDFNEWQKSTVDTWRENCGLKENIQGFKLQIQEQQARESSLLTELEETRAVIQSLQQLLDKRCNLDDDNRDLRKAIAEQQERVKLLKEENRRETERLVKEMSDSERSFRQEIDEMKANLMIEAETKLKEAKTEAQDEIKKLKSEIEDKASEISALQAEMKNIEEKSHTEVVRLRLEYDNKLQKLQKHAAKVQTSQSAVLNQEIYRKKLQHMKTESERQIFSLKQTIAELQQELSLFRQKSDANRKRLKKL